MTAMSLVAENESVTEPLEALRQVARSEAELDEFRWQQIAAARDDGASWTEIGEALGVSRQDAREHFARRVRDQLAANVDASDLTEDEALELAIEDVRAERRHRALEIAEAYEAAYTLHPLDEPDEWGDLASFREAAAAT